MSPILNAALWTPHYPREPLRIRSLSLEGLAEESAQTVEVARRLGRYYSDVSPETYTPFLKEIFTRYERSELEDMAARQLRISRTSLDGVFLREAFTFLKASICNVLAFKNLMCENYFPWGKVTLYYANFYLANSLLRLNGYAIAHIDHITPKESRTNIQLERNVSSQSYILRRFGGRDHSEVWARFTRAFPSILSPRVQKVDVEDREMWNYDPFYFSQGTDSLALKEARDFCENNFLDENFEQQAISEQDAERRFDLMSNLGYHEGAAGYGIREAIKMFGSIGRASRFPNAYHEKLAEIRQDINVMQAKAESRATVQEWLASEIRNLENV